MSTCASASHWQSPLSFICTNSIFHFYLFYFIFWMALKVWHPLCTVCDITAQNSSQSMEWERPISKLFFSCGCRAVIHISFTFYVGPYKQIWQKSNCVLCTGDFERWLMSSGLKQQTSSSSEAGGQQVLTFSRWRTCETPLVVGGGEI